MPIIAMETTKMQKLKIDFSLYYYIALSITNAYHKGVINYMSHYIYIRSSKHH